MRRCLQCMNEYPEEYEDVCPHCGYVHGGTENGSGDLRPGTILQGRYIVGTVLKSRDMDLCYIGWDALFERKVMIQEYFPRYCASRSAGDELSIYSSKEEIYKKGLELFYRQSRELIRLYKEEDIVTYHACFYGNKTAYAVMEYRKEPTLEEYMKGRTLKSREAMNFLMAAVRSLEKASRLGIFHGRLDVSSFWVTGNGRLVLKDFGAWRYVSGEPGIVDYGRAGEQTDVCGLAKLFCRMITGKEIADADKLDGELLRCQVQLKRHVTAALKRALAHQTDSLRLFEEELEGPVRRRLGRRENGQKGKKKKPLPKWILWACGGGTLLLTAAAVLAAFFLVRHMQAVGEEAAEAETMVRVPNVVNMDVEEAERQLRAHGLSLNQEDADFSDEIAEGKISYQIQKEGTLVAEGTAVQVTVSKGKEKYPLPMVIGLSSKEAEKILAEAGFTNVTLVDSQEEGAYDTVVSVSVNGVPQTAEPEEEGESKDRLETILQWLEQFSGEETAETELVEPDAGIQLTICKKEPETAAVQVQVPDVKGYAASAAAEILTSAGLQVNLTVENSTEPKGTVISQEPEAGEEYPANGYVTIRISQGPEQIIMPDLRFMDLEEAKKELEARGLKLTSVEEKYSATVAEGKIITQNIDPGTAVPEGQGIAVQVSLGAESREEEEADRPRQTQAPKPTQAPTAPAATTPAATTPAVPETAETAPAAAVPGGSEAALETSAGAGSSAADPAKETSAAKSETGDSSGPGNLLEDGDTAGSGNPAGSAIDGSGPGAPTGGENDKIGVGDAPDNNTSAVVIDSIPTQKAVD